MTDLAILAIDQGTTNTKALLVSDRGEVLAQSACGTVVHHPEPGWAEQSAAAIWDSVVEVVRQVLDRAGPHRLAAIGITNQRESAVIWDARTGEPLGPCVLWQCRRTSDRCAELRQAGLAAAIQAKTGLGLDPLFSATKFSWLLDQVPDGRLRAERGEILVGTVDSWLLWKLSGVHATDHSNASRTQLLSLETLNWDEELAEIFAVPSAALPDIRQSDSLFGETTGIPDVLPAGIPVHAIMGDSHAALFGHGIQTPGRIKVTCGTGSSLMTPTAARLRSVHGLSSTIAWSRDSGVVHALEGNIAVSGHAAAFTVALLGIEDEHRLTEMAQTVPNSAGICFVPALAGMGAPHWRDDVCGIITGMTLATTPAHVARASFEAIALQIRDVFVAIEADLGHPLDALSVDGGASSNDFLMQMLADLIDRPVVRVARAEISALGVARMAGEAVGLPMVPDRDPAQTRFVPHMDAQTRSVILQKWNAALRQACSTS